MREETLKRLMVLGFPTYEAYLNSDLWRANKTRLGVGRPKKCWACPSKVKLHAHHCSYDNVGNEQPGDLIVLCSRCHSEVHKLVSKGALLLTAHVLYKERLIRGASTSRSEPKPKPRPRKPKPHARKVKPLQAEIDFAANAKRKAEQRRKANRKARKSRSRQQAGAQAKVEPEISQVAMADLQALAAFEARSRLP